MTAPPDPKAETGDQWVEGLRALQKALAVSEARPLVIALQRLGRSLAVLVGNAAELKVTLDEGQGHPKYLELADVKHPDRLDRFLDELDRLLHNYLAASYTLSTHTQSLRNEFFTDGQKAEYASKSPFEAPLARFVSKLRNVTQHGRLPAIQLRMEYSEGTFDTAFVLNRQSLKAHRSWSGAAKGFLNELTEDPRLDRIVHDYTLATEAFTAWVLEAVIAANAPALAELHLVRQRLRDFLASGPPP